MKRKMSIFHKAKIFILWLKHMDYSGIIEVCGFCDSPKVNIHESNTNDRIYTAVYECQKCGGKAKVREVWYKEA